MKRGRFVYRSKHALGGYRRPSSIPSVVFAPGAVSYDHRLLLRNALGEYAVRRSRKHALFHSTEDLWNARLSMKGKLPYGKSTLEIKPRNIDSSTRPTCKKSTALSTGSDYCDGSSPSPWPFTMRTGDKEPSGSISHHMDHAHVECILDDTPIEARIWHSNGIHSLKLRIQQSLGMGS